MPKLLSFFRREPVLVLSALAALASCFFVPPDKGYLAYPDLRTLALLYCLMTVVAGLGKAGLFASAAHALGRRTSRVRSMGILLVLLSFFSSMLITNDVALLTFVPFTITLFRDPQSRPALIPVIVLETAAANLGSMLTPVGNPQNLYLYSRYGFGFGAFLSATFPFWALSLALLLLLSLLLPNGQAAPREESAPGTDKKGILLHTALFLVCLLTVLHILPWPVMLGILVLALLLLDRKLLLQADFLLLLTFLCFFVFSGNLSRIPAVSAFLRSVLTGREFLSGALTSQVISNVPAALLLSGFTENAKALLLGVNVGGLGTPIASLASLISLKLYAGTYEAKTGRFLLIFSIVNVLLLVLLSLFYFLF